ALVLLQSGRARRVLAVSVEDGGGLLQRSYARARRRGFGGAPPPTRLRPVAEDVAVAVLLGADRAGGPPGRPPPPRPRRDPRGARTGYARDTAAFERFVCRAGEGFAIDRVVRLEGGEPMSLGRILVAAAEREGCCLVVHRGEAGECGAVVFES